METALPFTDPTGHRISAVLATPDAGSDRVAVLCHGFLSHKNSTTNNTLTRMLLERGIATFRFDFYGQGESEGPFERITTGLAVDQATAAVRLMAARGFRAVGLMGSSFGGLVAVLTASAHPSLACLALKCPVVDFGEELRLEFGDNEMARWKETDTIPNILGGEGRMHLRYAFYEDCLQRIAYEPARNIAIPTLIVQGDADELIPLHQSRRLYEALSGTKRLELIPGADHQFTRAEDFSRMTSLIAEWLALHLPPVT